MDIDAKINRRRDGYYKRLADHKRIYTRIQNTLINRDGTVRILSYGRALDCTKKHAALFSYDSGGVYIARGKKRDYILGCTIQHWA